MAKLDLKVRPTNIKALKIDDSKLKTFGIILASFQVNNNFGKAQFFRETFLLADTKINVVLGPINYQIDAKY